MKKTSGRFVFLVLTGALAVSAFTTSCYEHRDSRYYDASNRDYHRWSVDEDAYYQRWEKENRREHREFQKRQKEQQKEYWEWRHKQDHDRDRDHDHDHDKH